MRISVWSADVCSSDLDFRRPVEVAVIFETARPGEDRGNRVGRGRLALLVHAVVAGDGAVRRLRLDRLAVRRHQNRRHEAKRAEALRHLVRLYVAGVILAGPDELAAPLEGGGPHVVDPAVLIFDLGLGELVLELAENGRAHVRT